MSTLSPSFEERIAQGREIEKAVAAWLMARGTKILPVYDYSGLADGKAPKFTAAKISESLVVPDLLGAKSGHCIWFEVKYKHHADFTRKTQQFETGISYRLWMHYQQVEQESGIPVWLLFAHYKENELRGERLSSLKGNARIYNGPKMGSSGMVFFNYRSLKRFAALTDIIALPHSS